MPAQADKFTRSRVITYIVVLFSVHSHHYVPTVTDLLNTQLLEVRPVLCCFSENNGATKKHCRAARTCLFIVHSDQWIGARLLFFDMISPNRTRTATIF